MGVQTSVWGQRQPGGRSYWWLMCRLRRAVRLGVMTSIDCPACGHTFNPTTPTPTTPPDPSVVHWFRSDFGWIGAVSTDETYGSYLRADDAPPVSREQFVADLAYLRIEEVLDDDTLMLVRP